MPNSLAASVRSLPKTKSEAVLRQLVSSRSSNTAPLQKPGPLQFRSLYEQMVDVKDKEVALERSKTAFLMHADKKMKDKRVEEVKTALKGEIDQIKEL